MPDLYAAITADIEEDLLPLSALLRQRGVAHQIYEEKGRQVLALAQVQQVPAVQELYRTWRAGELQIELQKRTAAKPGGVTLQWRAAPVIATFALISVATFLVFYVGLPQQWIAYLTFSPFDVVAGKLLFSDMGGQYWRLITPIFLHFGWLHIVFNTLWLWELGRGVERAVGSINTLLLLLVIAGISNVCQYVMSGPTLFGGMSGVVYGLLGFAWVAPLFQPRWIIQPAPAIMLFMVGWLLVCLFGVVEVLGFGAIANAAHVGGLVCGAVLGGAFGLLSRMAGSDG